MNQKLKRFEEVWSHDKTSFNIVKNAWNMTCGDSSIKIQATLKHLSSWGHQHFGDIPKKIKLLQDQLGLLKDLTPNNHITAQIIAKEKELNEAMLHVIAIFGCQVIN